MKKINLDGFCDRTGFTKPQAECILECTGCALLLKGGLNIITGKSISSGLLKSAIIGLIIASVIAPANKTNSEEFDND